MISMSSVVRDIADALDGSEYPLHIPASISEQAMECGVQIVYGGSDDLIEFEGPFRDELGAWISKNGGTRDYVSSEGRRIAAVWCETEKVSWTYRTDIPHETFGLVDEMDCPIMIVGSTMDLFLKTLDEYDETQTFATLHSMMDDGLAPCMICGERKELIDATVNDSNGEPMELTINGFNSKSFAICVDCMETFLELVDDLIHEKEGEE